MKFKLYNLTCYLQALMLHLANCQNFDSGKTIVIFNKLELLALTYANVNAWTGMYAKYIQD